MHITSDFVNSGSYLPDTWKSQRCKQFVACVLWDAKINLLIDLKMFFIEYPVCVISVAVVKQPLFLLVFVVLYNRRSIFLFQ